MALSSREPCIKLSTYSGPVTYKSSSQNSSITIPVLHILHLNMCQLFQRDVMVRHAEAIRRQSRNPPKAHTHVHNKCYPTNAGEPSCRSRHHRHPDQRTAHASTQDTSQHTLFHRGTRHRQRSAAPTAGLKMTLSVC